jgi:hypothetical protein
MLVQDFNLMDGTAFAGIILEMDFQNQVQMETRLTHAM